MSNRRSVNSSICTRRSGDFVEGFVRALKPLCPSSYGRRSLVISASSVLSLLRARRLKYGKEPAHARIAIFSRFEVTRLRFLVLVRPE
jgi:hypothetical protein